ncbi:Crp/Fnr family transcriptional regulator [Dyadobacter sp. Leaf189]|uniref:Crp/Fnr family transcriptional regulator n=1 Tax=Dyadobacter sp. Leaf189 TaxID=1736295 RepID=UPI0006F6ED8A|nr:Crp/Fnr family transcriptional regulator [Dyadobacter sp. Leaf189]KQS26802.1 Crp/Fnr family transcriptional regulator [Dyadobacter sp. Leaf189]
MFEQINQYALRCMQFSPGDLELFDSLLQHKKFAKKTFLLLEGEVCQFEAFILKGCIRTYYIDSTGAEVTLQFAIEDWWVSDITSFQNQTPSHMYIETLEDCEVLLLTPENKEKLLASVPGFERMFRLMVQRNLAQTQERLFRTISTSAVEKYLDFLNRYPTIPQRVAQHYIASYLGFSPEFLSKVRRKLSAQ